MGDDVGDIVGRTDERGSVDGEEVSFVAVDESKSPDANADLLCRRRLQEQKRWARMRKGGKAGMGEERGLLRRC